MSDVMALAALGKACHHGSRMRHSVAALASRNCFVLVFVTGYAGNILVFCSCFAVQFGSLLVAGGAHLVSCIGCVCYCGRHMCLVATLAVRSTHVSAMRLMALSTLRNLAVDVVAEATGQLGMLAWHLLQLDDLLAVAGQTLIGNIVGQFDDLWCMWIIVATKAAGELVVRLVGMALAALWNIVFNGRTMARMTILARNTGFVCATIGGNIRRRV